MRDEEYIHQIADEWELPVEQVALIWSVYKWTTRNWNDSSVVYLNTIKFIEAKMS